MNLRERRLDVAFTDYLSLFLFHIVMPLFFIISLGMASFKNKFDWLLQLFVTSLYVGIFFFIGSWDILNYYLRYIWIVLLLIAIIISWIKIKEYPFFSTLGGEGKFSIGVNLVIIIIFIIAGSSLLNIFTKPDQAMEIDFPLKNGTYYIGQGGNTTLLNYHYAYDVQKYAFDIVELNSFGSRSKGIYPKDLEKYTIYGESLYSPCDAKVVEVRDELPDLTPPEMDSKQPMGNYIGLTCKGYEETTVYLAHMKEDSILVSTGDEIQTGEIIGMVGNSGNTSEPHLHIHAEIEGKGVPIRFDNKWLYRNKLVRKTKG